MRECAGMSLEWPHRRTTARGPAMVETNARLCLDENHERLD